MKKTIHVSLLLSAFFFAMSAFAQTDIIFHKSHSGKASNFRAGSEDGFGLPSKRIMKIEKLSDSTVVFHHDQVFWGNDTVLHSPILSKRPRAIRKLYGGQVELVGFGKEKEEKDDGFGIPLIPVDPSLPLILLLACVVIAVLYESKKGGVVKLAIA